MHLLDTNICIALLNGNSLAIQRYNDLAEDCYISAIVVAELYKGVYCSQRVQQNLEIIRLFLSDMLVVEFDLNAAIEFGRIQSELRQIGKPTGEVDAFIAAIARSRNDTVVTDNLRHFINITGLKIENWLTDEL